MPRRVSRSRAFDVLSLSVLALGLLSGTGAAQGFSVVHSFTNDGGSPSAGLTQLPDGRLFGTTAGGGLWGQGSVFVLSPDGGGYSFATLHSFTAGEDGANPRSGLLLASDGNFYGTTYDGISAPGGAVYRTDPAGNLTVLHG